MIYKEMNKPKQYYFDDRQLKNRQTIKIYKINTELSKLKLKRRIFHHSQKSQKESVLFFLKILVISSAYMPTNLQE